jgi:hypothetical protein
MLRDPPPLATFRKRGDYPWPLLRPMGPKQLRLQEVRHLMLSQNLNAGTAGVRGKMKVHRSPVEITLDIYRLISP